MPNDLHPGGILTSDVWAPLAPPASQAATAGPGASSESACPGLARPPRAGSRQAVLNGGTGCGARPVSLRGIFTTADHLPAARSVAAPQTPGLRPRGPGHPRQRAGGRWQKRWPPAGGGHLAAKLSRPGWQGFQFFTGRAPGELKVAVGAFGRRSHPCKPAGMVVNLGDSGGKWRVSGRPRPGPCPVGPTQKWPGHFFPDGPAC